MDVSPKTSAPCCWSAESKQAKGWTWHLTSRPPPGDGSFHAGNGGGVHWDFCVNFSFGGSILGVSPLGDVFCTITQVSPLENCENQQMEGQPAASSSKTGDPTWCAFAHKGTNAQVQDTPPKSKVPGPWLLSFVHDYDFQSNCPWGVWDQGCYKLRGSLLVAVILKLLSTPSLRVNA